MTTLTPSLFDFVKDYAKELTSNKRRPVIFDGEENLLVFTREFFTQFFQEAFKYQIVTFDDSAAIDAFAANSQYAPVGTPAARLVDNFRELCQNYATIIGDRYDPAGERSGFQIEFVPSLLEHIREWAAAEGKRSDIAVAAQDASSCQNGHHGAEPCLLYTTPAQSPAPLQKHKPVPIHVGLHEKQLGHLPAGGSAALAHR